ncbi:DeoR/GlpR family DNA-binding transcription regulator [Sporosarcina sp. CAU 1771]
MFQDERHEQIMKELNRKKSIKTVDLSKKFNVTRETIRRDLQELEEEGLLKKVHGGAILTKTNVEPPYLKRSQLHLEEKEAIAKRAADLVEDGDSLYIDIGTTTLMMVNYLQGKKNLTVVTNGLLHAVEFTKIEGTKVILSGGEIRAGEMSLSGPISTKGIKHLYVDKSFIGVGGLSIDSGITDYHVHESELRAIMIENSTEVIALADFSKFGVRAFTQVCEIKDLTALITDKKSPLDILESIKKLKVNVDII